MTDSQDETCDILDDPWGDGDKGGKVWPTPDELLEVLRDVVDPEIGVSIVDLGLVYGVDITDDGRVTVDMTLTSPACPLTDQLESDVYFLLSTRARSAVINWVWMPPWTMDMISDEGREQMRAIGFNL